MGAERIVTLSARDVSRLTHSINEIPEELTDDPRINRMALLKMVIQ